jgi:hypothetical protein
VRRPLRVQVGHRWLGPASFVLLFGLSTAWALATPFFGAPDEPAHVIKAAAVAHGEFLGRYSGPATARVTVTVPATVAKAATTHVCFAFHATVSAGCLPHFTSASGTRSVTTYVGRYPPIYYLLVGLPTLVMHTPGVIYLMRLVSAAICAAFLTAAVTAARGAGLLLAGVAVAATPMALFLAGVVNPSGLEVCAAICVWVAGLRLVTESTEGPPPRGLVIRLVLAAAVLVQTRGLSPLWLALIGLTLLWLAGWRRPVALLRARSVRIGLAVVAVCGVFALVWMLVAKSLTIAPVGTPVPADASWWEILRSSLRRTLLDTKGLFGLFGWNDTPAPRLTYLLWGIALAAVVLAMLARRPSRYTVAVGALVVLSVIVPTLLSASQAHKDGIVGQGRYVLPLAVGIPIIAGHAAGRGWPGGRWRRLVLPVGAALLTAAQGAAFAEALRRYQTGVGHSLLSAHPPWSPPIPELLLLGGFGVLALALYLGWAWIASQRDSAL